MRAIILAAGEGSRLRPLTNDRPKCLVEYRGVPIIDYQLKAMRALDVKNVTVIKGYMAGSLIRPGVDDVLNPRFAETNMVYTLFCAEKFFDDDILVSYGDILYGEDILGPVLRSRADFAVAISLNWKELWQRRMPDPLADAETLKLDTAGNIVELGKKPLSYDEIQGQYMGLFKISRRMMKTVREIYHGMDRSKTYDNRPFEKMFMTGFIQEIINQGHEVKAVPVTGEWLEVDAPQDLEVECHL